MDPNNLCCHVNTIANCSLCKERLCHEHVIGHQSKYHHNKPYCRNCWWEVWREALAQAKKHPNYKVKPEEVFADVMGYSEEEARRLGG